MDIKVVKEKISHTNGSHDLVYYDGFEIYELLKPICKRLEIFFGCGIGRSYVHLDVDRVRDVHWYY